ncbi:hypothetical protein THRCLA_01378 [Thraustotheca clavata]|uniref:Secreted protein n=1 Tax=Thraustotheca clavata TaxID=74557 RepID=A0A1W0A8G4_9STRA|nr:hypothetical protein THRCLA_01378 [Thraustotheca clavata]
MNLRFVLFVALIACIQWIHAEESDDFHFHEEEFEAEIPSEEPSPSANRPQITPEVFQQAMEMISADCRNAIEANPNDPSKVSDECKIEIQTTLAKLMGNEIPNDPITPEIFGKMMEKIPAECRAEIEANPTDANKLSNECKQHIQRELSKLLPKEEKKPKTKPSSESTKPKNNKRRSRTKKQSTDDTRAIMIVLAFVVTVFAGIGTYAYTQYKKQNFVEKTTAPKKLSKKKLEKAMRKERAAAAM